MLPAFIKQHKKGRVIMAKYELNIYRENDEIEKTYATDNIKWGLYLEAAKVQDSLNEMSADEQLDVVNSFVKRMFIGLTDEQLERASGDDVFNVFNQLTRKARAIGGVKNAAAAEK